MILSLCFGLYFAYTIKYFFYDHFNPHLTDLFRDVKKSICCPDFIVNTDTDRKTEFITKFWINPFRQSLLITIRTIIVSYLRISKNKLSTKTTKTNTSTITNTITNTRPRTRTKTKRQSTETNTPSHTLHATDGDQSSDEDSSRLWIHYAEAQDDGRIRVLEVGPGRDSYHLSLASLFDDMHFDSVDINPENIALLNAKNVDQKNNMRFICGDVTNPPEELWKTKYNIIYAVDTLDYLNDKEKRDRFMLYASSILTEHGRLILADHFNTKENWIDLTKKNGFILETQYDLTLDVVGLYLKLLKRMRLVFYAFYYGLSSSLFKKMIKSYPVQSAYVKSLFMRGYDYLNGASTYNILVFQKKAKKVHL